MCLPWDDLPAVLCHQVLQKLLHDQAVQVHLVHPSHLDHLCDLDVPVHTSDPHATFNSTELPLAKLFCFFMFLYVFFLFFLCFALFFVYLGTIYIINKWICRVYWSGNAGERRPYFFSRERMQYYCSWYFDALLVLGVPPLLPGVPSLLSGLHTHGIP